MLRKKLKYDLESIFKVIIVFYGLALFFGLMTRLFSEFDDSFILSLIGNVCMFLFVIMLLGIAFVNVLRVWMRFRSDFYGDESYLTHTLPVKTETLFLSKVLTVIITLFVSIVTIIILLLVTFYTKDSIDMINQMLMPLVKGNKTTIVTILIELVAVLFLEIFGIAMVGYTGIILGHRKGNSPISSSVRYGFVTYLMVQVSAILGIFMAGLVNKDVMNLFSTNEITSVNEIYLINGVALIIYSVIIAIIYIVDIKLLSKGVNVE